VGHAPGGDRTMAGGGFKAEVYHARRRRPVARLNWHADGQPLGERRRTRIAPPHRGCYKRRCGWFDASPCAPDCCHSGVTGNLVLTSKLEPCLTVGARSRSYCTGLYLDLCSYVDYLPIAAPAEYQPLHRRSTVPELVTRKHRRRRASWGLMPKLDAIKMCAAIERVDPVPVALAVDLARGGDTILVQLTLARLI